MRLKNDLVKVVDCLEVLCYRIVTIERLSGSRQDVPGPCLPWVATNEGLPRIYQVSGALLIFKSIMSKYPYFPFYPADWLSSLRNNCLTLAQQGGYLRLLCLCWESGYCGLPDDRAKLLKLSNLDEHLFSEVYEMFMEHPSHPDMITSKRLFIEWGKLVRLSGVRSQAGRKSGKLRRTHVQHKYEQNANKNRAYVHNSESESYSESEVINQKEELRTPIVPLQGTTTFDEFWKAYPKKVGKEAARKAWVKAKGKPSVLEIIAALDKQKNSEQWKRNSGQFIPNPATWLNQGRWADEVVESTGVCDPNGFLAGMQSFLERGE